LPQEAPICVIECFDILNVCYPEISVVVIPQLIGACSVDSSFVTEVMGMVFDLTT
jgi:hypothetical protein